MPTALSPLDTLDQNRAQESAAGYDALAKASAVTNVPYANEAGQQIKGLMPVGSLSSSKGEQIVQNKLDTLNGISPGTAPGAVLGAATGPADTKTSTPAAIPKAYFTNAAGQEAEFTDEQLRDPKTQSLLTTGGYVQTRTEGPNYDPTSAAHDSFNATNSQYQELANNIANYNVDNDPAFQAISKQISDKYDKLSAAAAKANESRARALHTLGLRQGTVQAAGDIQSGIEGEELKQADARLSDLADAEKTAISSARAAYQSGKYSEFTSKMNALEKIRGDKQKTLDDYNKTLAASVKKYNDTTVQAQKDQNVANAISAGHTGAQDILAYLNTNGGSYTADQVEKTLKSFATKIALPEDQQSARDSLVENAVARGVKDDVLLETLNYNADGKPNGNNFTSKEVADIRKNLDTAGAAALQKMNGALGDFFKLQKAGILPPQIEALDPAQQPFAYVKYAGELGRKPATGGSGAAGGYKLTNAQRGKLIGTGLSNQDVSNLEKDINQHSLGEVLGADTGLNDEQKQVLRTLVTGDTGQKSSVPAKLLGQVRALRAKGAEQLKINDFIYNSGYDPKDPVFGSADELKLDESMPGLSKAN